MAKVTLREEEDLDSLLKRFKTQVKKQGIIEDCKKHDYFVCKSIKRKEKSKRARILANSLKKKNYKK